MHKKAFFGLMAITIVLMVVKISFANPEYMSKKAIRDRIQPMGEISVETPVAKIAEPEIQKSKEISVEEKTVTNAAQSPEKIYKQYCLACHDSGAAGAPKFGNIDAWKPRLAKGKKLLIEHAIHGYKLMPPKGTCIKCSDDQIKSVVEYIIKNSSTQ